MKKLFLFLLLIINLNCFSTIYYVDKTGGSDGNAGTSTGTAWQTISKVNGSSFSAGDYILFKCGEVWREQLTVPSSGSAGNPITFGSYGTGAKPIINAADIKTGWTNAGSNQWWINNPNAVTTRAMVIIGGTIFNEVSSLANVNSASEYFIDVSATPDRVYVYSTVDPATLTAEVSAREYCILGSSSGATRHHINVQNIECRYAGHSGVAFFANGSNFDGSCVVDECYFYANRLFGAVSYDKHNNDIYRNSSADYNGNGFYAQVANGITMQSCSTAHTIAYAAISQFTDGGAFQNYQGNDWLVEHCYSIDDNDAIHIDAGNLDCDAVIRYNKVFNSKSGSPNTPGYGLGNTASGSVIQMYYNLAVNCASASLESSSSAHAGTLFIYNNTFYHNTSTGTDGIIYFNHGTGYTFKNNLFIRDYVAGEYTWVVFNTPMSTNDYNNYFIISNVSGTLRNYWNGATSTSIAGWRTASSQDAHSLSVDPVFVDKTSDWHLQSSSPCINAGVNVSLFVDIEGHPIVGNPDIGCYEYTAAPCN